LSSGLLLPPYSVHADCKKPHGQQSLANSSGYVVDRERTDLRVAATQRSANPNRRPLSAHPECEAGKSI
jgi:hypothetical protein